VTALPAGWAESTLGEIGEYLNGRGFKRSEWRKSGRPIIRIQNLTGSANHFNYFDGEPEEHYTARAGDLLVSWAATLGVFVWKGPEAVVNQHIFKVKSHIDRNFHRYLLLSVLGDLRRQTHGSGMVHITKGRFEATPVAVPPLAEQRRIVATVDEQFSRLDSAEASIRTAKRRLDRMAAAILSAAFREVRETRRLAEVAEVRLGRQRSPKNHTGPNMRPYLRAANVTWSGLDLRDVKSMNFSIAEAPTFELVEGDVLLAEASGSADEVGKPAVWRGEIPGCCFQNTLIRVRAHAALPEYLHKVFLRDALTGKFAQAAPGVGIHHLGSTRLSAWAIPMTSLDEQESIVADIERKLSITDALAGKVDREIRRSASLRRSILEHAFGGKLLPQDASDEPAAILLEGIAAERAAAPNPSRRKSRIRA
jgi:type I restriction enzyme, S subunit